MNDELENEDPDEDTFAIAEHEPRVEEPVFEQTPDETAVASEAKAGGWLCQIDGNQLGPISSQQLRKLALAGTLTQESQVRKFDSTTWIAAGDVPKLFDPPKKKKKKKRTGHPAGYFPPILVLYGQIIMVACAIIGIANAVGVLLMTTVLNNGISGLGVLFLWVLGAFQSYIWFVGYKLGGGLSCGEKQAALGLVVLLILFCGIGIGLMFLGDGSGKIPGIIMCAVSVLLFVPPIGLSYKYRESLV